MSMKYLKHCSTRVVTAAAIAASTDDDDGGFTSTASRSTNRSHETMKRKEIFFETPRDAIVADYDNIPTAARENFMIPPIAKIARCTETTIVDLTSNYEKDGPPPLLPNCLDDDDDCGGGAGGCTNYGPQHMSLLPLSSPPESLSRPSLVHFFEPIEVHSRRVAVKRPPSINLKPSRTFCPEIIFDTPWAENF